MIAWEYKTMSRFMTVMEMDELGANGWQLVTVCEHNNREFYGVRFYFCRPVEPKPTDE